MGKTVIIGAGPCGLFFALKLQQAGVNNILIADPHAGEYVRPGNVNIEDFEFVEKALGLEHREDIQIPHIKDVERLIYQVVKQRNIEIVKKRFIRFNRDPMEIGVILADQNNLEELVKCNYAFDCSGASRVLVSEVNRLINPPPFNLKPIVTDIKVPHNLIAYGLINRETVDAVNHFFSHERLEQKADYHESIAKLRQFGWQEFTMPFLYGYSFTDEKGCLYTEAPAQLIGENKIAWINCLLEIIFKDSNTHFKEMAPSKKYGFKPRIEYFYSNPVALKPFNYQGENLPRVIALGDAQLESYYRTAHGTRRGIERIIPMMKYLNIYDGQISAFRSGEYYYDNKHQWRTHKLKIKRHLEARNQYFQECLPAAKAHYEEILSKTELEERENLLPVFNEIRVRLLYENIISSWHTLKERKRLLLKLEDKKSEFIYIPGFPSTTPLIKSNTIKESERLQEIALKKSEREAWEKEMTILFDSILYVDEMMPSAFNNERIKNKQIAAEVAMSWKELATTEFKEGNFINALDKYDRAFKLLRIVQPLQSKDLLVLSSNKIICWLKQENYSDVILDAIDQLNHYQPLQDTELLPTQKKIFFNLVTSFRKIMEKQPQALPLPKESIADFIQQSLTWYATPSINNNQLFTANQEDQKFINETVAYLKAQNLYTEPMDVDEKTDNRLQM